MECKWAKQLLTTKLRRPRKTVMESISYPDSQDPIHSSSPQMRWGLANLMMVVTGDCGTTRVLWVLKRERGRLQKPFWSKLVVNSRKKGRNGSKETIDFDCSATLGLIERQGDSRSDEQTGQALTTIRVDLRAIDSQCLNKRTFLLPFIWMWHFIRKKPWKT